jgi:excisionase family DNA binding protein
MELKNKRPAADIPVQKDEAPAYMRLNEAAGVARLSVRTLRRAIYAGKLKASKMGTVYVIRRERLIEWLESGESGKAAN